FRRRGRIAEAQGAAAAVGRIPSPGRGHAGARGARALCRDHHHPRRPRHAGARRQARSALRADARAGTGGAADQLRRAALGRHRGAARALHGGRAGQRRALGAAAGAARGRAGRAPAGDRPARRRRRAALHRDRAGQGAGAAHADGGRRAGRAGRRRRRRYRGPVPRRPRRRMSARARLAWALGWLGLLLAVGGWLSQTLSFSGDLRRFLPDPRTPEQRLLIDELGEGPGSRLLLVALAGADVDTLAAQSHAMAATLSADARFGFVANGAGSGLEPIPPRLRPYRYLLSPTLDVQRLDAQFLRAEIAQRVQDLGSPAGELVEPLLPSDPTLETLRLAEAWLPARAPQTLHEAWFDRSGTQALLLVETRAAGFDPDGQREAVEAIQAAHAGARGDDPGTLELSGPGAFADEIGSRTAREAGWIGAVDSIGLVLLLLIAYRSWKIPLLGALPLASAGIAGLATLVLLFGDRVHGITIAFGFTLIGVVQDYPIHFFSQQRAGLSPWRSVRALWPTLATGVAATCIAY